MKQIFNRKTRGSVNYRGFTLVELLVVVAIIGVLAAILSPVLAKSRNKANRSMDLSNMKNQVNAFTLFSNDQKGRYPWLTFKREGTAVVSYLSPGGGVPGVTNGIACWTSAGCIRLVPFRMH